jgi:DNA helicase INO80
MTFWKKRDKEITDLKRKREKYEKELRKRQEEEREAVLQKKRLEFIM